MLVKQEVTIACFFFKSDVSLGSEGPRVFTIANEYKLHVPYYGLVARGYMHGGVRAPPLTTPTNALFLYVPRIHLLLAVIYSTGT